MSLWSKIRGTVETVFQIGLAGPQLKASSGSVQARSSDDSAFAKVQAADPSGPDDLATKRYADSLGGGGTTRGTATLDFGSFPGSPEGFVAVTGQAGILATSRVAARIRMVGSTALHSSDEHAIASALCDVVATDVAAGVGFAIRAIARGDQASIWGTFEAEWEWS